MEKRKSALYTTAGTGWLTFLLMPSHEPCHFSEDMDRCLPVLTPLWPHRKLHVSLCFQVMARVPMFLGPSTDVCRLLRHHALNPFSDWWVQMTARRKRSTVHSIQYTLSHRVVAANTTRRSFYVSHFTASNESQTRQVACLDVVYSQRSAVFWPQMDPNSLTMRGPLLQRSLLSERTRVSSLLSDCIFPPLLCVFWGKVLVGYEAGECASGVVRGAESFSWVQRFSLLSLMAPRCFLKQQPLSLTLCICSFSAVSPLCVSLSFHIFCPLLLLVLPIFSSLRGSHPSQKCSLHLVWS